MLVRFSELGPSNKSSIFTTEDDDIIYAIRHHKFFKEGKISEFGETPNTKKVEEVTEDNVPEFSNISELKSYLRKIYGEEVLRYKSPISIAKYAEIKGVKYKMTKK